MIVRLFLLAHGRSGDKGDAVNIGVIAREARWADFLTREISTERVIDYMRPLASGPVERFVLPNLGALNFVLHGALGGGGSSSLQLDAQGKTYAQALFRMPIEIPESMAAEVKAHWGDRLPKDCVLDEGLG